MSTGKHTKKDGSFYTPVSVASVMCDMSGLSDDLYAKSKLTLCDPSCGDGGILSVAADKMFSCGCTLEEATSSIYGCELDPHEALRCRENLASVAFRYGYDSAPEDWHIASGDAFRVFIEDSSLLPKQYDYIIGNPPYVRIHNLDSIPESKWIDGMCDLYYAFYDLGLRLLDPNGRLCYISASSWMSAKAGIPMRKDLQADANISSILDFEHAQLFANASAYTAIVVMEKKGSVSDVKICRPKWNGMPGPDTLAGYDIVSKIPQKDVWCGGMFVPVADARIKEIMEFRSERGDESIRVRNGFATNSDSVFIAPKGCDISESRYVIDIAKASKAVMTRGIYPYDKHGKLIPFSDIQRLEPALAEYFSSNSETLHNRSNVPADKWYGYGRSQGIEDVETDKIAIQSITKDGNLRMIECPAGTGVYGGIYVVGLDIETLREAIDDPVFFSFVKALGKYKSGGYYTFSGKELEKYLRWWHHKHSDSRDGGYEYAGDVENQTTETETR